MAQAPVNQQQDLNGRSETASLNLAFTLINLALTLRSSSMAQAPVNQQQNSNGQSKTASLDLAFTLMQDCLSFQLEQVEKLDTKANAAQVAATALVGAALVLEAALITLNSSVNLRIFQILALLPLLIVYGYVIYLASSGYDIRQYERVPAPKKLLENLDKPEEEIKRKIFKSMEGVFYRNEEKLNDKVRTIDRANFWLKIETLVLIAILLTQAILRLFIS